MGTRLGLESSPNLYLAEGEEWPYGDLVYDAPPEAHLALAVSRRFHNLIEPRQWKIREISDKVGISAHAVFDLLKGNSWGTLPVIARIEMAFDTRIWGREHKDLHMERRRKQLR